MGKRDYLKQLAFAALVIGASFGLYLIVPKNKALLLVIIAVVFLLTTISMINSLDSRRLRIDYERGLLVMKKPELSVGLDDLGPPNWEFVHQRMDTRTTITTVVKLLRTGLFLVVDGKRINCSNRVDEKDYRYLASHCSAPVLCLYSGKHAQTLAMGENRLKIKDVECFVACSQDELEFIDAEATVGVFKKRSVMRLRLSRWGGSFKLGKTWVYYESVRPFTIFF
jgi:hypothetical protein